MFALAKLTVLFAFALSASALVTPHFARSPHGHHAIAARLAAPAPAVGPYGDDVRVVKPKKMRKRGNTGRCKARSSSAAPSSTPIAETSSTPSSSSTFEPTSTFVSSSTSVSSSTPVVNVAPSPSSSSSYSTPAPVTTSSSSSKAPAPKTTSTTEAPAPTTSSSSKAAAPTTSTSSSSSSSGSSTPSYLEGTQTGEITFYEVGLGACGVTNTDSDRIAAVSELLFDSYPGYDGVNPNDNPVCGKSITITYQGKSTTVTVEDRCVACAETDLDLSPTSFLDLAAESVGRLDGATWVWNN